MPDDYKKPKAFKQSRYLSFDSVSVNDSTALENYTEEYQYDLQEISRKPYILFKIILRVVMYRTLPMILQAI
jgi:hypothetical protein